jgi:hypothetical protein
MKKSALAILFVVFTLSSVSLFANTSLTGSYGYFTIPITATPDKGTLHINTGYIFEPGNFYLSANIAFLKNWELSMGKEILTEEGQDIGATPFIMGSKYMFYEKGGFRAAGGIQIEFPGEAAGVDGTPISLYGVISDNAGKLGYVNLGLGYTFGIDAGYNINFFTGIRTPIISDKLFLIGEFTNFSIRQGQGIPWDVNRGVFNAGLVLEPVDFLKFKFVMYDLLDDFLTVGLGGEVKLKLF